MRAELANLNHCAVPFLSLAAVNLCWYNYSKCYCYCYIYNMAGKKIILILIAYLKAEPPDTLSSFNLFYFYTRNTNTNNKWYF